MPFDSTPHLPAAGQGNEQCEESAERTCEMQSGRASQSLSAGRSRLGDAGAFGAIFHSCPIGTAPHNPARISCRPG